MQVGWQAIYYATFLLCWLVLPFAQEYEDSGEFTPARRLRESLVMNGILIGLLCVGAVLGAWLYDLLIAKHHAAEAAR